MNTIAISDLRNDLPSIIDRISRNLERLTITVSGKVKAVLISQEELESLEETAEILSIPGMLESIKKSSKQIREGKTTPLSKLKI